MGLPCDGPLVEVADEGALVGTRPRVNFTGAGVTATDVPASDRVDVDIPAGGGGGQNDRLNFRRVDADFHSGLDLYGSETTKPLSSTRIVAVPFYVPDTKTADLIMVRVTTAIAGNARLGIYNDGANLYPGTLLLDAGTVAVGTTGCKQITISQALSGALYWLAVLPDPSIAVQAHFPIASWGLLGHLCDMSSFGYWHSPNFNFSANPLPNPYPANAAKQFKPTPVIALSFV